MNKSLSELRTLPIQVVAYWNHKYRTITVDNGTALEEMTEAEDSESHEVFVSFFVVPSCR